MDSELIDGVKISPLRIIETEGGNILHAMKSTDNDFNGFGEAYFSIVHQGAIKAWKRHRKMTLNLVVPVGSIRFVMHDDRKNSPTKGKFQSIEMSKDNYQRLSVPPMVWLGFEGCEKGLNMLLNIADIPHDPKEADNLNKEEIEYNWR